MTATLTFNLPEDQEEFYLAAKGAQWRDALEDTDNYLRDQLKHDDTLSEDAAVALQVARDKLHEFLEERDLSLW